jgi:hypothetical protein
MLRTCTADQLTVVINTQDILRPSQRLLLMLRTYCRPAVIVINARDHCRPNLAIVGRNAPYTAAKLTIVINASGHALPTK